MKKNKLLKTEEYVVCPNCGRPLLKAKLLDVKGSAYGKNFCAGCAFEIRLCFKGTAAAEFANNVCKSENFFERTLGKQ